MTYAGMGVAAVEAAANQLKNCASRLDGLTADIGREVGKLPGVWEGQDSRRFVTEWWPRHKSTLASIAKAIEGLGQSALNNAKEQRDASGDQGSSATTPTQAAPAPAVPQPSAGGAPSAAPSSGNAPGQTTPGVLSPWDEASYRAFEKQAHWVGTRDGGYYADANGKAVDNCTAWVAWRREELGLSAPHGNGGEMAANAGGNTSTPPTLGAIVSDTQSAPPYGHVMVIEQTYADGSFRVSETNISGSAAIRATVIWKPLADGRWQSSTGQIRDLVIAP